MTTTNQHFSSNPTVISPKENLHIFICVTSSSASCLFLSACVTKPNSITVGSVGATNPLLCLFRLWKKACTSHWHEYMYILGWIQFCVSLLVFGLKLSLEVCTVAMTLDKMPESGAIVKSKMIPLCSLWQHGLNSFMSNTCFLWQLLLIIDDNSQKFLSSSQLQEGQQMLLFLHAAG